MSVWIDEAVNVCVCVRFYVCGNNARILLARVNEANGENDLSPCV